MVTLEKWLKPKFKKELKQKKGEKTVTLDRWLKPIPKTVETCKDKTAQLDDNNEKIDDTTVAVRDQVEGDQAVIDSKNDSVRDEAESNNSRKECGEILDNIFDYQDAEPSKSYDIIESPTSEYSIKYEGNIYKTTDTPNGSESIQSSVKIENVDAWVKSYETMMKTYDVKNVENREHYDEVAIVLRSNSLLSASVIPRKSAPLLAITDGRNDESYQLALTTTVPPNPTTNAMVSMYDHLIMIGDKLIKENKLEQAEQKYHEALKMAKAIYGDTHSINADILVKISNIQQGQREMADAVGTLSSALEMYKASIEESKSVGDRVEWTRLETKLVQVMIMIADIFVDMGEFSSANETYEDAIQTSQEYLALNDPVVTITLNSYGNFVSICGNDQDTALRILKLAMKVRVESLSDKDELDSYVADTLCNMGKVYMRLAIKNNNADDEVKRAEACFIKALQIYRLLGDKSGKCAAALYNLTHSRDWHHEWKQKQVKLHTTSRNFKSDDEPTCNNRGMKIPDVQEEEFDKIYDHILPLDIFLCCQDTTTIN